MQTKQAKSKVLAICKENNIDIEIDHALGMQIFLFAPEGFCFGDSFITTLTSSYFYTCKQEAWIEILERLEIELPLIPIK